MPIKRHSASAARSASDQLFREDSSHVKEESHGPYHGMGLNVIVGVCVTREENDALKRYAVARGLSKSSVLRLIIRDLIGQEKKKPGNHYYQTIIPPTA